jgi:hypothetical protein
MVTYVHGPVRMHDAYEHAHCRHISATEQAQWAVCHRGRLQQDACINVSHA